MLTLSFTPDEVSSAPPEAQAWLARIIGIPASVTFEPNELEVSEVEQTPDLNGKTVEEDPAVSQITKEDLQEKAKALIVTDEGKAVLKKALGEMGLQRVSNCPDDRLAELLSKIAVA